MIFTPYESSTLIELLETSCAEDFYILTPQKAEELISSSLNKLKTLSALTCFSKQEYTLLAFLVYDECEAHDALGIRDVRLVNLRDKLLELSEAHRD